MADVGSILGKVAQVPLEVLGGPIGVGAGIATGGDPLGKVNDLLVKDTTIKQPLSWWLAHYTKWQGHDLARAHGAVYVESRGNPRAQNFCCTGLMQIHEDHAGKFGAPADKGKFRDWLKDPGNNLSFAYQLEQANPVSWGDWSSEGSAWESHTTFDPIIVGGNSKNTLTGNVGDVVSGAADAITSPIDAVGNFLGTLTDPSTWLRVGKFALGGVLIVAGTGAVLMLAGRQAQASAIARALK